MSFQLDPSLNGYDVPRIKAFHAQLLQSIRSVPGVTSAGFAAVPVLHGYEWDSSMSVEGHQAKDGEDMQAFMNAVSPEYWKTMGIKLIEGRDFDARDTGTKTTVAIVNRKFATHFFGEKSAIGRRIGFGGGPKTKLDMEIIGVTEDTLYEGPRAGVHRQAFVAMGQSDFPASATFYVRGGIGSAALFPALRQKVRELDAAMPIYELKTLEAQLDETLGTERLIATLSSAFGILATLLAALGLYGVMAFVVARRTKEIGLRMALGAPQGAVLWMVMREALVLLGMGLAVGIPVAYGLSRYVSTQLYGVKPTDLVSAAVALVVLAAVAVLSGWLPARRASSIDPILALRYE